MVAAGVYLVARTYPLFEAAPPALTVVAVIGGFTAIFAATMGLASNDIKRILAYSTVSQLGYMMLALGAGSLSAGMFHLVTHAFFKALLFLAAGSVIHSIGPTTSPRWVACARSCPARTGRWQSASLTGRHPAAFGLLVEGRRPRSRRDRWRTDPLRLRHHHRVSDGVLYVPHVLPDISR